MTQSPGGDLEFSVVPNHIKIPPISPLDDCISSLFFDFPTKSCHISLETFMVNLSESAGGENTNLSGFTAGFYPSDHFPTDL